MANMISTIERMNICVSKEYLRLQGSATENFFFTVLFPWLCFIGIIGNCLNLTVLLSTDVKNRSSNVNQRSNVLLVALAFCDILFLILMIPHSLANFDFFGLNMTFRMFYLPTKVHLISLANWCSAVAIWLVIAICAERLIGIRSFQHSKTNWSYCTTTHIIIIIIAGSALLTSYNHFSYHCIVKLLCNKTQIISKCFDVIQETWPGNHTNMTPTTIRLYVSWSQVANVIIVIVLPILIMLALNIALLFVVRKQSFLVYSRLHSVSTNSDYNAIFYSKIKCKNSVSSGIVSNQSESRKQSCIISSPTSTVTCTTINGENFSKVISPLPPPQVNSSRKNSSNEAGTQNTNLFRRSIDQTVQFQTEHRVTVTVCAIVTCFTITQGPSAVVLSMSFLSRHNPPFVNSNALWYHVNSLTGFLVIIGKTLNFILFCLSSAAFRRRLKKILHKKFILLNERRFLFFNNSMNGVNNNINCVPSSIIHSNAFNNNNTDFLCRKKFFNERKISLAI